MSASNSTPPRDKDENLDPITGEPGAHPIGTGLGAVAAGAASGALGGAVAGGLAGKGIAESIDPTAEDAYWGENYASKPYVAKGHGYDQYKPAYQSGWEAHSLHADKSWDEIESGLEKDWASRKGTSKLDWADAKHASRDAFERVGTAHRAKTKGTV